MLKRIINAVLEFFGQPKPYEFPKMSRDEVFEKLEALFEGKQEDMCYVKELLDGLNCLEKVKTDGSNIQVYKIKETDKTVWCVARINADLYKHCQYYGITNFNGFEIKPCKNE